MYKHININHVVSASHTHLPQSGMSGTKLGATNTNYRQLYFSTYLFLGVVGDRHGEFSSWATALPLEHSGIWGGNSEGGGRKGEEREERRRGGRGEDGRGRGKQENCECQLRKGEREEVVEGEGQGRRVLHRWDTIFRAGDWNIFLTAVIV